MLDRALVDDIGKFNGKNCDGISNSALSNERCRCTIKPSSSVVSTNTGQFMCVKENFIDRGKYLLILHSIQCRFYKEICDNVPIIVLACCYLFCDRVAYH